MAASRAPGQGMLGRGFCLFFKVFFCSLGPHQRFPVKAEPDRCTSQRPIGTLGVGAGAVDTGPLTPRQ